MRVTIPPIFDNGIPLIEHLQTPLTDSLEICKDIETRQSNLSNRILELWNLEQANNNSLRGLIGEVQKTAAANLTNISDDTANYLFTGDNFSGEGQIDKSSTIFIDKSGGFIVLPIVSLKNLNSYISEIKILPESEGRPGDLATVRSLTYNSDGSPNPEIASDPHNRLEECIDSKPDTWFTWEQLFVPRIQKIKRSGPQNAIIGISDGQEDDIVNLSGNYGFKWSGVIPGQGTVEKDVFTFTGKESVQTNSVGIFGLSIPNNTIKDLPTISKRAKLVIEFSFTNPVPLSTIQITPFIETSQPDPVIEHIDVQSSNTVWVGSSGLPRQITSLSGRNVSVQKSPNAVGQADFAGSGVFPVRPGSAGTQKVRIEFTSNSVFLSNGVAHKFYVKNTETNEQSSILGFRIKNKTSRGQEREDGPQNWQTQDFQNLSTSILTGPLNSAINTAKNYVNSLKLLDPKKYGEANNKIQGVLNKGIDAVATNSQIQGVSKALSDSVATAKNFSQLIGNKASSFLGLAGPVGVIAGAALSGNLFKNTKSTRVVSEESGVDLFTCDRAAIMIRDINFDSRIYDIKGDLFSETLFFGGDVRAVSVFIQYTIPVEWPLGPWITCRIRPIVEGQITDWVSIKPGGSPWTEDSAPTVVSYNYYFQKIQVNFSLQRPSDTTYQNESPVLTSYVVKGLPA